VRGLVKRDGTVLYAFTYRPYGALADSAGSGGIELRYRWTGREWDAETGWYFHRSRYYDPAARRFVQEDPIGYAGGRNKYAYAEGRVMEAIDPDGMAAEPRAAPPEDPLIAPGVFDAWDPLAGGLGGAARVAQHFEELSWEIWGRNAVESGYYPDYETYTANFQRRREEQKGAFGHLEAKGTGGLTVAEVLDQSEPLGGGDYDKVIGSTFAPTTDQALIADIKVRLGRGSIGQSDLFENRAFARGKNGYTLTARGGKEAGLDFTIVRRNLGINTLTSTLVHEQFHYGSAGRRIPTC